MAAPAAAPVDAQTTPWRVVVAAIDAMPGVPSWKEMEHQVYERVKARILEAEGPLLEEAESRLRRQEISAYFYREEEDGPRYRDPDDRLRAVAPLREHLLDDGNVRTWWTDALYELFRPISLYIREYKRAWRQLEHGALTWFALRYVHTDPELVLRTLGMEWRHADNAGPDPDVYAMTFITPELARRLLPLQVAHAARPHSHPTAEMVIASDHFIAALRARIMQERTDLALSGLIDRVALRQGTPLAQHLARFIAPDTVTLQRPLQIHQHASQLEEMRASMSDMDHPDAVLDRATRSNSTGGAARRLVRDHPPTLASILSVMRAPAQDPAATLARARNMLDTLMQSIDSAALPLPSSPSPPPATHW